MSCGARDCWGAGRYRREGERERLHIISFNIIHSSFLMLASLLGFNQWRFPAYNGLLVYCHTGHWDDPGWHQTFSSWRSNHQVWPENTKLLMSWWNCGVLAGLTINISCFSQAVLCLPLHHKLHSCINYPKRFLMSIQCKTPGPLSRRSLCPGLAQQSPSSQSVSPGKYICYVCV